jgi:hypothetical protein
MLACYRKGFDCGTMAYPFVANIDTGSHGTSVPDPWRLWDGNELPFNKTYQSFWPLDDFTDDDSHRQNYDVRVPIQFHVPRFVDNDP